MSVEYSSNKGRMSMSALISFSGVFFMEIFIVSADAILGSPVARVHRLFDPAGKNSFNRMHCL